MNKKFRKTVIAGNWKMNKTPSEAKKLIEEIKPFALGADCEVVVCVPYVDLLCVIEAVKGTNIKVGAQNVYFEKSGAFTGEISADMLKDTGADYVIIGHSERRQFFAETDITVNKKLKAALSAGLKPIVCIGETLEQREQGITNELVALQLEIALLGIEKAALKNIIIAYEPVWAIGTGRTATSEQADEVNGIIRSTLASLYGNEAARGVTIQYGGSMNAANAAELLAKENVDGGLIGGASLKAEDFGSIIKAASI